MTGLLLLGLALVAGIAYWSWLEKKKRREEISVLAARLGLRYDPGDPFGIDESMPHRLFSLGDGRDCENVMWGVWEGMPVTAFDYWYYEESTDAEGNTSRSYRRYSCAMTQIPADCAHLIVTRESIFSRLADSLGFRDIEFESGEFNRAWQVKCPDKKFATDFVDQRMMAWLMHAGTNWSFEIAGPLVLVYTRKLKTSELLTLLHCMKAFCATVPRVVPSLYPLRGDAPATGAQG